MYVITQHSPNHLYYVHNNLFQGGGKATFAFSSEKSPSFFLEIQYLPPLRYLIQLYRAHQISVGFREQISWDEYGPTIQVLHKTL